MADVGLSILEGVANGGAAYRDPSKRNIGLLGQFIRGVALTPTKVTSMEDFNNAFGGQSSSFYGPGMVRSIFKEAGEAPVTLWLARVVGTGAVAASGVGVIAHSEESETDDQNFDITMRLTAGYRGKADVGAWANGIKVSISAFGSQVRGMYTLKIVYGDKVETYNYATLAEIQVAVNKTSKYVIVEFSGEDSSHLVVNTTVTLTGGVEGVVTENDFYPSTTNTPRGLDCFEGADVQIVAVTEYHCLTMATQFNNWLNKMASPVGIINLPLAADENTAELYADALQTSGKSFLAGAYMGWAKVPDDNGNAQLLPVIAPVLGAAYLRTPYIQGDYIHIPPGGEDSLFNFVTEVIGSHLSQSVINRLVQQLSCNPIFYEDNFGYYVGSSRTYSTNALYCSVHIRQQTSYYVRALQGRMRFTVQKPNTPELKNSALKELYLFFKNEYDNGALERSVDFDEAYIGICDSTNNPAGQDRKLMNIDVQWIPTECTESVRISLQRNDGSLTATEV